MFNLKFGQTSGINSVFIDTLDDNGAYFPIDFSNPPKFDDPPSESSKIGQEVKVPQPIVMVIPGPHNLAKIFKLSIQIFMRNYFLNSLLLVVSSFLKDFKYFQVDIHDLQDIIFYQMKGSCLVSPFSCGSLVLDQGLEST